ncbi:anti-sigma factor [uncultured Amnibacterium sp.]|uniref:anti-sigma factor n=1 Tax=uncultured Amnibacterium sp. TaxID=1631851 RepID=UPI0035CC4FBD
MTESEDLHSEVVGLVDTAVTLGLGLPPVSPPPALRARLLDLIETTPQEQPDDTESFSPLPEAPEEYAPVVVAAMPAGQHHVPVRRARRRRRPLVLLASLVAAVAIFAGGSFVTRSLFETQTEYSRITLAADTQKADGVVAGGGTATVYWSKSEHRTAVVLNGVQTPGGKVLQLWSVRGGTITSAGLYEPEGGDHYMLLSGTPNSGETLAVSVEPDGGSSQPTTDPIVRVQLRA